MPEQPRLPAAKVRLGAIGLSIWENRADDGRLFHSFTIQRSYQDQSGTWQNTDSFRASDAMALVTAIQDAYRWIAVEGKRRAKEHGQPADATVDVRHTVSVTDEGDIPF